MLAAEVLSIFRQLDAAGLFVSIDGGWGIDALLGHQTRPHDDLDLVVDIEQVASIRYTLESLGYQLHEDEMPVRFVLAASGDRRIDFHPMHFDDTGFARQQLPGGKLFTCRISALNGTGRIDGWDDIRCLTPELQLQVHLGYQPDEADRQDIGLICERFGFVLPEAFRS